MPSFRFVAIDSAGELQRGLMEAPDVASVVERLQRQGHIPMRAEPADRVRPWSGLLNFQFVRRNALSRTELAHVTREMSIMLSAGQDLDRALRFMIDTAPTERVKTIIGDVREKVRGGSSLAAALQTQPGSFSKLYIGLVRAGEAGGALGETLERLAQLLERERNLTTTVQSALIYPALLFVAATGAVMMLLTYVLPEFVPLFEQSGATLPWSTQLLIDIGQATGRFGPWALLALLLAAVAVHRVLQQPGQRLRLDRQLLRLWIIGPLLREVIAARFTRTLGSLLRNGVPLIGALGIARDAIGNQAAAEAVDQATQSAKRGAGLAEPLAATGIFPARTLHLIRLGEETAQLAPLTLRAADIHDENVRISVQRLIALLVPSITIVMGLAVAGIVGSLMIAMLSLNDLAG